MISANAFRRMALGMSGAIEGSHMDHPDFRANGKIFATIWTDNRRGMVKLAPQQQEEFLRVYPAMFEPASGAWGRQGCTMVRFSHADADVIGEAMTLAWQGVMAEKPRRKPAAKTPPRAARLRSAARTRR